MSKLLTHAMVPAIIAAFLTNLAGCATPRLPTKAAAEPYASAVTVPPQPKKPLPLIASPEDGFGIALEAYKVGEMEAAALYAESVMERYPTTPWHKRSLFLQGRTFIARGMTADAEKIMLRIPIEYPDLADYALFQLAEHYYSGKRYTDAVGLYQRLTSNYQSSSLVARASLKEAQALYDAGLFGDAATAYERTLSGFPRSEQAPEAGLGLGRALADAGDLPGSVRAFLDVRVRYPGNGNDAEVEKALAALAVRGAQVPKLTADEHYERGKNLFRAMQYDKASESFRSALEADPSHPQRADMLLRSGIALYHLGRRPEAASTLERLIKARLPDCRCAEALNWLGKAYSRLGLRDEAVETYLKLVRMYPESDWSDDALYNTGNVYRDANDIKKALQYYRQLIGRDHHSFEHKGCVFVLVNTQFWKAPVNGESERHDSWLEQTLQTASKKKRRIFIVGHYPLFLEAPDEAEEYMNLPSAKRRELLGLFKKYDVVAVLGGHAHRLVINDYQGIQLVNGETTSRNFDKRPLGFRLWHVMNPRPFEHEFVPLEGL